MGMEWSLNLVEPVTFRDGPGERFVPSFSPIQLDAILVGRDEGPVSELLDSGKVSCDHDRAGIDWSRHMCPPPTIPVEAVRRCAARLSNVTQRDYAPMDFALSKMSCDRLDSVRRALYAAVAEEADLFRKFIAEAADGGWALRCWMR
ncbi:hypothetical protein [Paludisphaera mucosa]|uniref:DUF1877 domain-containing protein n=1 Tax=Paludisphaera mucosa TaxID=3030827 RepID=A0ABT6F9C1_9BACT|nr:hypothetical protein [Paludisphaera mucosa]MDG3003988.1 hypothetical protein [Paludisphaera mucosa]